MVGGGTNERETDSGAIGELVLITVVVEKDACTEDDDEGALEEGLRDGNADPGSRSSLFLRSNCIFRRLKRPRTHPIIM